MNEPFKHFPTTKPAFRQHYLPTAFDNELTLLEKFNKLRESFNLLVIDFNSWIDYANNFESLFDSKEDKENITKKRHLSPSGNFTGRIENIPALQVISNIANNASQLHYLIGQFSDGQTGLVVDGGYFDQTSIRKDYDGGVF